MTPHHYRAFGLVELMMTLFLATCLLTLMMRHYLTVKKEAETTINILEQAYEQQLISEFIRNSVRHAGFTPCASIDVLKTKPHAHFGRLVGVAVDVGEKKALQVSRMSETFTVIKESYSTQQVLLPENSDLNVGETILIADCFHAEVNTIQSIQRETMGWRVDLTTPLNETYIPPIYLGEWIQEQFYIDKNKKGQPALYYQWHHAEELSSVIQLMTVKMMKYGMKRLVHLHFLLQQKKSWDMDVAIRL